jgi:hypothetical protein
MLFGIDIALGHSNVWSLFATLAGGTSNMGLDLFLVKYQEIFLVCCLGTCLLITLLEG